MKYSLGPKEDNGLHRIIALIDIPCQRVKAGDLGGYVASEKNLSQKGNAWVYGDARVSEDAWVYGDARVLKTPITIANLKHPITITETHVFIGCEGHTKQHWAKNIRKIGRKNGYNKEEVDQVCAVLNVLAQ